MGTKFSTKRIAAFRLEGLETRRLLSCSGMGGMGLGGGGGGLGGPGGSTITFAQSPTAVQTGLTTLASTDGFTAPTSTSTVYLGNVNGIEEYSLHETGTGTSSVLTVDVDGNPVTAATKSTTTFGAITTTAVTDEINAIVTALDLTAPTSTTNVNVSTPTTGPITYTIALTNSDGRTRNYSVDSTGAPVGNEKIPFSVLPTAVQNTFIANAPTGVTITSSSTRTVQAKLVDGVQTYTMTFGSTGITTTITVDEAGDLVSLPTTTKVEFDTIPSAAQTELQALATADGVTTTISTTQNVRETTEPNGTDIYTIHLTTSTGSHVVISVDEDGNATVPAQGGNTGPIFGGGFAGIGGGMDGGFFELGGGLISDLLHGM
ncbi:MAG: hypothetical protein ABSG31_10465 [Tepidisphaeraceae bacterium]|jgi:hypothetical protein